MGSGSVRSSHQTVSDYTLRQWFPNTQQSRFLTACRRLEKLVLPSIFDVSLSSLMMWNLCSYPTKVLNERMWHFNGSKHTLTALLHIFRGGQDSQPTEFTPPVCRIRLCSFYMRTLSTNVGGRLCWLMSDSGLKWKKTSLLVLRSVVVYLTLSKSKTIEWVSEQGLTSSQRISETSRLFTVSRLH